MRSPGLSFNHRSSIKDNAGNAPNFHNLRSARTGNDNTSLSCTDEPGNGAFALRQSIEQNDRQATRLVAAVHPGVVRPTLDDDVSGLKRYKLRVVEEHVYFARDADHVVDSVRAMQAVHLVARLEFHHRKAAAIERRG